MKIKKGKKNKKKIKVMMMEMEEMMGRSFTHRKKKVEKINDP